MKINQVWTIPNTREKKKHCKDKYDVKTKLSRHTRHNTITPRVLKNAIKTVGVQIRHYYVNIYEHRRTYKYVILNTRNFIRTK